MPCGSLFLVCLPENALYMRLKEGEKIEGLALDSQVFRELEELSQKRKLSIHIGSVPLLTQGKLRNASVLVELGSGRRKSYEKIHLFDIELENQKKISESDVFSHGLTPEIFSLSDWQIGQAICYDLRFSELFSAYANLEADLILVPAAFLVETGKVHWEVLLRARAIESQCYIVAAAQAGTHQGLQGDQRATFGNSLVIDPWGRVLWRGSPDRVECQLIVLQKSEITKTRRQIPMRNHRRLSR